jgi:hypothetical protein
VFRKRAGRWADLRSTQGSEERDDKAKFGSVEALKKNPIGTGAVAL